MDDMELQVFAERLKELRTEKNLTQAQFVDGLGITASALSAYEKNQKNPSISVAKRIADKYNVSIDWLCGLSDKKVSENKISTYRELFEYLLLLTECEGNFYLELDKFLGVSIVFADVSVRCFFEECGKMKRLLNDGTIDEDVYNFWLEKFLNTPNYANKLNERREDFFQKIAPQEIKESPFSLPSC